MDRLSELPESVLCHILSFLPTKLSVKTSILAKRWRFLWTYVPNLDLEGRRGREGGPCPTFSDIVNKVMLLHNVQLNLNTFRLEYTGKNLKANQLGTWITTAIFRKVQNLNLCLNYQTALPRCLVTCKTLVDMRLWNCAFELLSPTSVHLPSLKKLHLHTVTFTTDETFSSLISGCPVLEEFLIHEIKEDDLVCLRISSPTLKWVKICVSNFYDSYKYETDYRLELNAPALEYLKLTDWVSKSISADPVPTSLIEADISLCNQHNVDEYLFYDSVLGFIYKLRHVKSLKLSLWFLKFLENSALSASTVWFHNLTKLQLCTCDWRLTSKFIENAENLEVLIIDEFLFNWAHEGFKCWLEARQVPNCLSLHLTTIKFCKYQDSESGVEMVRYLLKNALVLKTMEIYAPDLKEARKFSALQKISLMPRGSATCEVTFYSGADFSGRLMPRGSFND